MRPEHYPQILVGAGYVGCLLALLLRRAGQRVLLIERGSPTTARDDRHFGIAKESRAILQDLGLWDTLAVESTSIRAMNIVTDDAPNEPWISLQNPNAVPVGRMIPAALLQSTLRNAVVAAGVDLLFETSLEHVVEKAASLEIETSDGQFFSTSLLVAADGMNSSTRDLVGIEVKEVPFEQQAQQWKIVHENPHEGVAHELLLPEGPYVVLPTPSAHCSKLVWCCDKERPQDDEQAIIAHFPKALGEISLLEYIGNYPLIQRQARQSYRGRVVLVGDAYQRVHPVAAQGLNLGLRDAEVLSKMLIEAENLGLDPGSDYLLQSFANRRYWDRAIVRQTTNLLGRKNNFHQPIWRVPKRILGKILATPPAKKIIRTAFHGE